MAAVAKWQWQWRIKRSNGNVSSKACGNIGYRYVKISASIIMKINMAWRVISAIICINAIEESAASSISGSGEMAKISISKMAKTVRNHGVSSAAASARGGEMKAITAIWQWRMKYVSAGESSSLLERNGGEKLKIMA
jgi:hypothetical protein